MIQFEDILSPIELEHKMAFDQIMESISVVDDIFEEFNDERKSNPLPEPIFVNYFLPYFSGKLPIDKKSRIIAEWCAVAGSPIAEVSIINQSGGVLYKVPALFRTDIINPVRPLYDTGLHGIFDNHTLHKRNLPMVANRNLNHALMVKSKIMLAGSEQAPDDLRWLEIFKRYGVEIPLGIEEVPVVEEEEHEELIYD
jgi:hypothetical protein